MQLSAFGWAFQCQQASLGFAAGQGGAQALRKVQSMFQRMLQRCAASQAVALM